MKKFKFKFPYRSNYFLKKIVLFVRVILYITYAKG